jgi:phosphoglycolate phosphatase-like HAD superfamily hydrolase
MSEPRLVLFDIDGTLLNSHGAGRRAMESALQVVFGVTGSSSYRYDGKTDRQIVREQMRNAGHDDAWIDARMPELLDAYLEGLRRELAAPDARVDALTGVVDLLDALVERDHCVVGLLTGNLEPGAREKLAAARIEWEQFRVGAFGSDHEVMHELPAIAQARARERFGREYTGSAVVIIGDTPADIHCGRPVGARAIAVATGNYTVDDLSAHGPAAVFADLGDTTAVIASIDDA